MQPKSYLQSKIETQTQRTNEWIPRGKEGGGINWETGIDMYTTDNVSKTDNQ